MPHEITPPAEEKPVTKSWTELRKEARAKQQEKVLKKYKAQIKSDEPKSESKPDEKSEDAAAVSNEAKPEKTEEAKTEEPKIDVEAVARKAAKEAAQEVAEQAKQDKLEFQTKLDSILTKDADMQQKQKDADELIATWDKEKRLPKDYAELIQETMRIADAKMAQRQREAEKATKSETPKTEPTVDPQKQALDKFQSEIVADLNEIYSAKFMPKPQNMEEINNPNTTDEAAKETQKLFEFGVKLNTERRARGLEPVTSINKIYFLHYKPYADAQPKNSNQPAGADAPVSPSRNQSVTSQNSPQPFYQKGEDGHYRPKSWAQIKYEALKSRIK